MPVNMRQFTRKEILERLKIQDGLCNGCGKMVNKKTMRGDHILPWSKGGPTEIWNLQVLCSPCNHAKSDMFPVQWAMLTNTTLPKDFTKGLFVFLHDRNGSKGNKPKFKHRSHRNMTVSNDIPPPPDDDIKYLMPKSGKDIYELAYMDIGESLYFPQSRPGGVTHASVMEFQEKSNRRFKVRSAKPKGIRIWRVD